MSSAEPRTDVCIMGGGLAGLSLGIQLRQRCPSLGVTVIERRSGAAPVSAFKIGESSVEIGAHYFAERLGLRQHLEEKHLKKFGFRFFFNDGRDELSACPELGPSDYLSVPTYQIDRGVFENHLAEVFAGLGGVRHEGATVQGVNLAPPGSDDDHGVNWAGQGGAHTLRCRWVIDAGGRAGMLRRKLDLHVGSPHHAFAVWFRVRHRLDPDRWGQGDDWRQRCGTGRRWLSTNHLCGRGYWVWLIPLASGSHSVGIVADPAYHDFEALRSYEGALAWLARQQPQLHAELAGLDASALQDFAFLKHFSHDCQRVLSGGRWALTGDAGRFLDPFYSPGSDFIAMTNGYIVRLIEQDARGEPVTATARRYDAVLRTFFDNMLPLYLDQYGVFGHPPAMSAKVVWDYTYYWHVLAPLFFHDHLHDVALLGEQAGPLARCNTLNRAMQTYLRVVADAEPVPGQAVPPFFDHARVEWFVALNRRLREATTRDELAAQLQGAADTLAALAAQTVRRLDGVAVDTPAIAHARTRLLGAGGG